MLSGPSRAASLEAGQALNGLLDWTPQFQQSIRDGTLSAADELPGTDLLGLCVLLDNAEACRLLLDGRPAQVSQARLDELLTTAARQGQTEICILLAGSGARPGPAALDCLADPALLSDGEFAQLLPLMPGPLPDADWMRMLVKLLPRMDDAQLTAFLARGTDWSYAGNAADGLLAACLDRPGRLEQLQRAGLDLQRCLAGNDAPPLLQICSAYRTQRSRLESRLRSTGNGIDPKAVRELAEATNRLLAQLPAIREGSKELDVRLPQLAGLSAEEYILCTAVANPEFYRELKQLGLNLNATDGDGNSALNLLTMQGLLADDELLALSELGMDPLLENYLGYSALHFAILNKRDALAVQWLEKARSPQLEAEVALGRMREFEAAVQSLGIPEKLAGQELEKGMLLAARSGRIESLQAVMTAGHAPLMQALVMLGMDAELGKAFFNQNLLINENVTIDSSLTLAVRQQDMGMLQFLFSVLPKDQRWIDQAQDQALLAAAAGEDRRFIQALLDYGVPAERSRAGGLTALVAACAAGKLDNVLLLIQQGADPGHGLNYLALQLQTGTTSLPAADAASLQQTERILRVLLSAANLHREGSALDWTGSDSPDPAQNGPPALLCTLVALPGISRETISEAAMLSSDQAFLRALEICIINGNEGLLEVLLSTGRSTLNTASQRELAALSLPSGRSVCRQLLRDAGFAWPEPDEAISLLLTRAGLEQAQ
jgi:ankyrin repeat protein